MYDVIIVGARCAGASTAMLLARKGHRVLLVERAKLPSDIPHGHFIHRGGPARLARWGLLDRILATGCPAVEVQVLDLAGVPLVGRNLAVDGVPFGCGPRRKALDKVLVDAAIEAGADLRDQFTVNDVLTEDGRVVGIAGRGTGGRSAVTERARLVIGADGRNSRLARIVGAATYQAVPALTCWYFSYWSGDFERALALHAPGRNAVLAFPSNDGLHAIFIAWPIEEFGAVRKDLEGRFMEVVQRVPDLAGRIDAGRREERFYGTADLPNFYRVSSGPGWALVGDAGCHKDPYLALGITDALRDAELLADAAHEGLSGVRGLQEALVAYQQRRDAASQADYDQNIQAARLGPPPEDMKTLLAALSDCEDDARQFFLARQGLIPPEAFFNPTNMQRIMAAARG